MIGLERKIRGSIIMMEFDLKKLYQLRLIMENKTFTNMGMMVVAN